MRAVHASFDPATACTEVAVHKGFAVLECAPRYLTSARLADPARVVVVGPEDVPNPTRLTPAPPSRHQQAFGAALLRDHGCFAISSPVSRMSWNIVFDAGQAEGLYADAEQARFGLDTRLQGAG